MWCIHLSLYIANLRLAGDASSESPLTVPQHGSRTLALMTENPRRLDIPETCHPNTWAIYRYWQEKCHGRSMPARSDLDPLNMPKGLLPGLCLVDVAPEERRYVYRLVDTANVEVRGYDPTGKSVIEGFFGPSVDDVLANYDRVVSSRAPHIDPQHFKATNGRYVTEETIFLPLSDDGENVNIVLVFSQSRDSRSAAAPRACRE